MDGLMVEVMVDLTVALLVVSLVAKLDDAMVERTDYFEVGEMVVL